MIKRTLKAEAGNANPPERSNWCKSVFAKYPEMVEAEAKKLKTAGIRSKQKERRTAEIEESPEHLKAKARLLLQSIY